MTGTPFLFPVPAVPPAAASELQLACSASALVHRQLGSALTRGGWTDEGVAEIGRMIAASKSMHEQLHAMLQPAGGKR